MTEAEESPIRELLAQVPQQGTLRWIGLRPAKRAPMRIVTEALLEVGRGIDGDRYLKKDGKRQVSLIQQEHLPVIGSLTAQEIDPALLRRNLVIEGIPVATLRRLRFSIGDTVLVGTDRCAPCRRMEEALGPGGYAAMFDMGGILARVEVGGVIRLGDPVRALGLPDPASD